MFQVGLAAIPLLLQAQGAIAGQVHATVGAADHRRGMGLVGWVDAGARAFELAPEPHRRGDQNDPEQ